MTDEDSADPSPDEGAEEFDRDEWVETEHDRVFYKTDGDIYDRGELELGAFITEHIPGWTVLITMGPYRDFHEIAYELHPDEKVVHLDCYSAAFVVYGDDVSYRKEHPAVAWAESAIHEIAEGIKKSDAGFDEESDE